jgi:hypothetical protein
VQHLHARRDSGVVDRIDGVTVGGAKGKMQLPGLGTGGLAEPEAGNAVGTGQTDDERVAVRKAHHLAA